MSRVVVVKYSERVDDRPDKDIYRLMLESALRNLTGEPGPERGLRSLIPKGLIGIKTNCIVRRLNSTPVALTDALTDACVAAGSKPEDIYIWERTNRELKHAGYELNVGQAGRRCLGTDTKDVGYSREFYSYGKVNSLVSRVLTDIVDYNINATVLKDHSLAGLSAAMKNMYGAIHNPNKYHGNNCSPFCAHISNLRPIRSRNRLHIVDACRVQYHGGPGFIGDYLTYYGGIIISDDPVAADTIGLEIIEHLRKANGMRSLADDGRPVRYLAPAQEAGLGTAERSKIDLVVRVVSADGSEIKGRLFS